MNRPEHNEKSDLLPTPAQLSVAKRVWTGRFSCGMPVDPTAFSATTDDVKLRHLKTKLSRLDLTEAAREATALKAQFRREDAELYRQGRGDAVLADRMKNLGFTGTAKTEVLTVNGVRIKS